MQEIRLPLHLAKVVVVVLVEELTARHNIIVLVAVAVLVLPVVARLRGVLLVAVVREQRLQSQVLQSHTLAAVVAQ